ncbi:unnamed protein product [Colias eurytheme]|nr:unnamed protein product [Colias eurytheme]
MQYGRGLRSCKGKEERLARLNLFHRVASFSAQSVRDQEHILILERKKCLEIASEILKECVPCTVSQYEDAYDEVKRRSSLRSAADYYLL